MADPILSVHNLRKLYLERVILDDVSFTIHAGERIGLLGLNGAGKTTLLKIVAGVLKADEGEVRRRRDLEVSYLDQEGGLRDDETVGAAIEGAFTHLRELEARLDAIHTQLENHPSGPETERLLNLQSDIAHRLEEHDLHTLESRKQEAMLALGLPPVDRLVGQLSGGERRRVALCRNLLEDADLLLLDEPTNHLDAETLDWLEDFLSRFRGTVMFVTHDRYFLDRVATKMVEVAKGRALVYQGNYSDYLEEKEAENLRAEKAESTRVNLLRRELEWLRRQPKARTTKSKSRIDRAHALIDGKPDAPIGSMQLLIPSGPRLGSTLIEAENLSHQLAGRQLINDFTFRLGAGQRVGIVGRNGLGKTTLLRILMKILQPDSGEVVHGPSVKFVYGDQKRESIDLNKTVLEEVSGGNEYVHVGEERVSFRTWLGRFLFTEQTAAMPLRLLSGGERNRVQLAKMLREGGNIVILDEPTNDLDLQTLRVLEEALAAFEGSAFIVSHDRYFLNRVANRIIAFQGDGNLVVVEGNYEDYRRYVAKKAEADAAKPPVAMQPSGGSASAAPSGDRKREEPSPARKKLSFNEQRELEKMEDQIMAAEEKLTSLTARLHDPASFAKASKEEANKLVAEEQGARLSVEKLYARWEELLARKS
jgi:ATP-binding cassette subfamily F protein uup